VRKLELETFDDDSSVPPYVILSHTWGPDEVTLQDFQKRREQSRQKQGYSKIQQTCSLAISTYCVDYVWIDTCCIDKKSSAELSEAINSMYRWYANAKLCVVYLEDLEAVDDGAEFSRRFQQCRWFTRGWCLQELIAPKALEFHCSRWRQVGSRHDLADSIRTRTGISDELLKGYRHLADYSIAQRMSWAANRQTRRTEDRAYSLLGIFDVNMPLLYGEGNKAFLRLQEEILKESQDLSIFAWQRQSSSDDGDGDLTSGLFTPFLDDFALAGDITVSGGSFLKKEVTLSNKGVKFEAAMLHRDWDERCWVLLLDIMQSPTASLGIFVMQIRPNVFIRIRPSRLKTLDAEAMDIPFSHQSKDWLDIFEMQDVCNYTLYMPKVLASDKIDVGMFVEYVRMESQGMRFLPRLSSCLRNFCVVNVFPGALWLTEAGSFVWWGKTAFAGYMEIYIDLGSGMLIDTNSIVLACGKGDVGGWCHLSDSTKPNSTETVDAIHQFQARRLTYYELTLTIEPRRVHAVPVMYTNGIETGYVLSAFVRHDVRFMPPRWQVHFSLDRGELRPNPSAQSLLTICRGQR
jgi:hypothetical protein